ncbi:hypothetical protein EGW08_016772 [Elysia chlorotica]|uniref:B box-type domain-containing protein n=1 Tax=Elysia chlorotica TaxID=188477 RepID=A0A3S1AYJ2_ELYCH|nr:hypothetical protein EGW08_016772 [Elysia chlorotica]
MLKNTSNPDSISNQNFKSKLRSIYCDICGQIYRLPRILPCLHSFCTECILNLPTRSQSDDVILEDCYEEGHGGSAALVSPRIESDAGTILSHKHASSRDLCVGSARLARSRIRNATSEEHLMSAPLPSRAASGSRLHDVLPGAKAIHRSMSCRVEEFHLATGHPQYSTICRTSRSKPTQHDKTSSIKTASSFREELMQFRGRKSVSYNSVVTFKSPDNERFSRQMNQRAVSKNTRVIICPKCSRETQLSPDLHELPRNFILDRLVRKTQPLRTVENADIAVYNNAREYDSREQMQRFGMEDYENKRVHANVNSDSIDDRRNGQINSGSNFSPYQENTGLCDEQSFQETKLSTPHKAVNPMKFDNTERTGESLHLVNNVGSLEVEPKSFHDENGGVERCEKAKSEGTSKGSEMKENAAKRIVKKLKLPKLYQFGKLFSCSSGANTRSSSDMKERPADLSHQQENTHTEMLENANENHGKNSDKLENDYGLPNSKCGNSVTNNDKRFSDMDNSKDDSYANSSNKTNNNNGSSISDCSSIANITNSSSSSSNTNNSYSSSSVDGGSFSCLSITSNKNSNPSNGNEMNALDASNANANNHQRSHLTDHRTSYHQTHKVSSIDTPLYVNTNEMSTMDSSPYITTNEISTMDNSPYVTTNEMSTMDNSSYITPNEMSTMSTSPHILPVTQTSYPDRYHISCTASIMPVAREKGDPKSKEGGRHGTRPRDDLSLWEMDLNPGHRSYHREDVHTLPRKQSMLSDQNIAGRRFTGENLFQRPHNGSQTKNMNLEPQSLMCDTHSGQELNMFCLGCEECVCQVCVFKRHTGHDCRPVTTQLFKQQMEDVDNLIRKAVPNVKDIEQRLLDLEQQRTKVKDRAVEVAKEVNDFMNSYFDALEKHKVNLLSKISRHRQRGCNQQFPNFWQSSRPPSIGIYILCLSSVRVGRVSTLRMTVCDKDGAPSSGFDVIVKAWLCPLKEHFGK